MGGVGLCYGFLEAWAALLSSVSQWSLISDRATYSLPPVLPTMLSCRRLYSIPFFQASTHLRGTILITLHLPQRLPRRIQHKPGRIISKEPLSHIHNRLNRRRLSGLVNDTPDVLFLACDARGGAERVLAHGGD